MKYTEPRYTKDLDIWIEPTKENAQGVFAALSDFGAPLQEVTPEDFTRTELIFQIGLAPHRIDILMAVKGLEFARAWEHRVEASLEDVTMSVVSKEDLIIAKEAVGRPQDLIDAAALRKGNAVAKRDSRD
jgi:hypothetical protein